MAVVTVVQVPEVELEKVRTVNERFTRREEPGVATGAAGATTAVEALVADGEAVGEGACARAVDVIEGTAVPLAVPLAIAAVKEVAVRAGVVDHR